MSSLKVSACSTYVHPPKATPSWNSFFAKSKSISRDVKEHAIGDVMSTASHSVAHADSDRSRSNWSNTVNNNTSSSGSAAWFALLQRVMDISDLASHLASFLFLSDLSALANTSLIFSHLLFHIRLSSNSSAHRVDTSSFCVSLLLFEQNYPKLSAAVNSSYKNVALVAQNRLLRRISSSDATDATTGADAGGSGDNVGCTFSFQQRACSSHPLQNSSQFNDTLNVLLCVKMSSSTILRWKVSAREVLESSFRTNFFKQIARQIFERNRLALSLLTQSELNETEHNEMVKSAENAANSLQLEGFTIVTRRLREQWEVPLEYVLTTSRHRDSNSYSQADSGDSVCELRNDDHYEWMYLFFQQLRRIVNRGDSRHNGLTIADAALSHSSWIAQTLPTSLSGSSSAGSYLLSSLEHDSVTSRWVAESAVHSRYSLRSLQLPCWSNVSSARHLPFLRAHLIHYNTAIKSIWLGAEEEWLIGDHLPLSLTQLRLGRQLPLPSNLLVNLNSAAIDSSPLQLGLPEFHNFPRLSRCQSIRHLDFSGAANYLNLSSSEMPLTLEILENVRDLPKNGLPSALKVLTYHPTAAGFYMGSSAASYSFSASYASALQNLQNLQWLTLYHHMPVEEHILPPSLTAFVSLGSCKTFPFVCGSSECLPSLTYLQLSDSFDQPLRPNQLRSGLVILSLSEHYIHPISPAVLPSTLRRFDVPGHRFPLATLFSRAASESVIPPSLECLSISGYTDKDVIVQTLCGSCHATSLRLLRLLGEGLHSHLGPVDSDGCWTDESMEKNVPVLRNQFPLLKVQLVDTRSVSLHSSFLQNFIQHLLAKSN